MDLAETIVPNSEQLNAEDLLVDARTFTVERVTVAGTDEQPVNIHLAEMPGRPYRPSKSMRRVLVAAWGRESEAYAGRRLTLYRDPEVTFGRDKVGGIKISHLSHITKIMSIALTVTRGRRAMHTVDPLTEPVEQSRPAPTAEAVAACMSVDELRVMYRSASDEVRELIIQRVAGLAGMNEPDETTGEPQ